MAAALFKSKKGKEIVREGKKNRTFTPGAPVAGGAPAKPTGGPNAQDMEAIKVTHFSYSLLMEDATMNRLPCFSCIGWGQSFQSEHSSL